MENEIIINGTKLTKGQSMTVRVALSTFMSDCRNVGLGEDEMGKAICNRYMVCINQIQEM